MKSTIFYIILIFGLIFTQDLTPKNILPIDSADIDCRDSFYCQTPDYSQVYNMSTGFDSEIADDIPNELVGNTIEEITLWVGEYYGDWQDPDGVTVNFYYEECPPELEPVLSYFIRWPEWETTEVYDGYALVYESTATLPEPIEIIEGMSIGAFVNISWGSAEPFAGICATAMWESFGCGPAYLDGDNWGYTRWTSIDNFTNIPQDLAFCLSGSIVEDNVIHVPEDYETIQEALNIANEGDTVLVASGTYYENITWPTTNSIKLIGSGEEDCIIDGNHTASVIRFEEDLNGIINTTTLISDFTITNGYAQGGSPNPYGGGIYLDDSNPSLVDVTITGNLATSSGGGIYLDDSDPSLENVTISNNSASSGGGIYCSSSSPSLAIVTISNNSASSGGGIYCRDNSSPSLANVTISNNFADFSGGGIYCFYNSSPSLENVTITGNSAYLGGGISCYQSSSPSLENVTISNNSASSDGGGIFCGFSSSPSLVNCILWNDAPQEVYFREDYGPNSIMIAYSDIQGGEAGIVTNDNGTVYWEYGNLDLDPFFTDPENGDYHLTENSPCIDAGTAFFVFEGDTLVNMSEDEYYGTAPDMGAFEYDGTVDNDYELEITNYELGNAYPNPFNPSTTISYAVETNGRLSLQIYNITGQLIETLVNEQVEAGYHTVVWFAENQPSGIYFAKLVAGDFTKTQKLVLLK